tara:strand:- start:594 stop:1058 length:465 start_codon:yes stop_codon:yes gene_type:complete
LYELKGFRYKIIIGSFLPKCQYCIQKVPIKIRYRLTIGEHDISLSEIPELISMVKFIIKNNMIERQNKLIHPNDHTSNNVLSTWIESISFKESKNEELIEIAKEIYDSLSSIWNKANNEKYLPCNINILIKNVKSKEEIYNTFWSYQYCQFFFE